MTCRRTLAWGWILSGLAGLALAQRRGVDIVDAEGQRVVRYARSHALLIGVSDYTAGWPDLPSVPGELEQVRLALEQHGFETETVPDPGEDALRKAIEDFIDAHGYVAGHRLLVFFAGHGHSRQNGQKGYLVPADAPRPSPGDPQAFLQKALPMTQVLTWARQIEARHALFVFDSCFSGSVFHTRGTPPQPEHISALMGKPVRQFLTAGTAGEQVPAQSAFVPAFVRALAGAADLMRDRYVTGTEIGVYVHQQLAGTGQTPQFGELPDPGLREGDFVFRLPALKAPPKTSFTLEDLEWEEYLDDMKDAFESTERYEKRSVKASLKMEAWRRFETAFGEDDPFSEEDEGLRRRAAERLAYWQREASKVTPEPRTTPAPSPPPTGVVPEAGKVWTEPALGMRFRYVPAGKFRMGSPTDETGRDSDETPHMVTLTRGSWMGEREVTQGQWRQLMKNNPSELQSCGDECPVETVSWWDAVTFANRLSKQAGLETCYELVCQGNPGEVGYTCKSATLRSRACNGFRLPTEAEWERAARAGTETATYAKDGLKLEDIAWCRDNSKNTTHPVGGKQPNDWELHDMLGNVREWVEDAGDVVQGRVQTTDTYAGDVEDPLSTRGPRRVNRGGSFAINARSCRAAFRYASPPGNRYRDVGFRVLRISD